MDTFTTGQMIDKLGLNDVAVNQDGFKVGYDHKGNLLMWGGSKKLDNVDII